MQNLKEKYEEAFRFKKKLSRKLNTKEEKKITPNHNEI